MRRVLLFSALLAAGASYAPPIAVGVPTASAALCADTFGMIGAEAIVTYHEGTLVQRARIGKEDVPDGAKVYLLGVGSEAEIYRIVPKNGESYILRNQNQDKELSLLVFR